MLTLPELNGQQAAIDAVLSRQSDNARHLFVVTGPTGSGVSWVLEQTALRWQAAGGVGLLAEGEAFAKERKFFPWLTLTLPHVRRLARLEVLKSAVTKGSEAVPVVGSVASFLIDELLHRQKRQLGREAVLLSVEEQDLFFVIQASAGQKRLLLALDQIEAWDAASWNLLELILSGKLDELYPALATALIVVGNSGEPGERTRALFGNYRGSRLSVRAVDRDILPAAMAAFALSTRDSEETDTVYEVTNGRLDLLRDFATDAKTVGVDPASSANGHTLSGFIARRLSEHPTAQNDLEALLSAAAVLGQSFLVDDVRCLTGQSAERLDATLQEALAQHFLDAAGEIARFRSATIHLHFREARAAEHAKHHGRFADCLRTMRPGDYEHRLHHLLLGNRLDDALTCYALAALAAGREHRVTAWFSQLQGTAGWPEIERYLEAMRTARRDYEAGKLADALRRVDSIESFLPEPLVAERDYLHAQVLLKAPRLDSFRRAVALLEPWRRLRESEAEIWSRLAQALMVALVQTGRVDEARRLEEEITAHYWGRRRVDPWALYGLNVLRRRAECLHQLPAATLRMESALAYFGGHEGDKLPRHPVQYYCGLTNLVGNLVASGRFADAHARALELDRLAHNHPSVPWPAPENAASNFVLAAYCDERLDATEAAKLMERIRADSHPERSDHVLIENNFASYLARAGRVDEARVIFQRLYTELQSGGEPDEYHVYFIGNNLTTLAAAAGNLTEARRLHGEIGAGLAEFYPAIRTVLQRRHTLIGEALTAASHSDGLDLEAFLSRQAPQVGPEWRFYGRGILFSDIQFWSAD